MVTVPHRLFRTLQLLALFQLVGGPLVIGSLVMFAQLTRHEHVTLATLPSQVCRAAEMAQSWQNAPSPSGTPTASTAATEPDSRQRPTAPTKPGKPTGLEDPAKMTADFSPSLPTAAEHLLPTVEPPTWIEMHVASHTQPPPSPPPRSV